MHNTKKRPRRRQKPNAPNTLFAKRYDSQPCSICISDVRITSDVIEFFNETQLEEVRGDLDKLFEMALSSPDFDLLNPFERSSLHCQVKSVVRFLRKLESYAVKNLLQETLG